MERYIIENFIDENSGLKVCKSYVYTEGSKSLLIEENGHIILLDTIYLKEMKNKRISSALYQKLKSRGFIGEHLIKQNNTVCKVLPEYFMVDLTNKCNMQCKYCLRNINSSSETICERTIIDICEFINNYCEEEKVSNISIQPWGGETLLELSNILLMREKIQPFNTKVHFSIETNGVLLNEKVIDKLYRNKIGLGISIDGYAAVHDAQRVLVSGGKTHSIVERNLLIAKEKYEDRLGIITTVTQNNADVIEDVLEYFACKLKLSTVKLNYVHKSMFNDCSDLCLSNEEISNTELRILKKLIELNERGYHICEYNIRVKMKNLLYRQYSDICHSRGCLGGRKMIVIDKQGMIYPCELTDMPNESFGSIYDNLNLIRMLNTAISHQDYFVAKVSEACKKCEWYIFCRGGCSVRAMSMGKKTAEIDDTECAINSVLYPALVELFLNKPELVNKILGEKVLE